MAEESDDPRPSGFRTMCFTCGGTGRVNKPRLFLSLRTGEPSTVLESGHCPCCRDSSGSLPGIVPPV
jgi:hypothetical protein